MTGVDLLLENCKIVDNEGVIDGFIAIERGKIYEVSTGGNFPEAENAIDLKGKIVMPGCIDPHVHFRDPGYTHKEDFKTGSLSAIHGGVTTIFDMPNTKPRTSTKKAYDEKRHIAAVRSCVDYGIFFEIRDDNIGEIYKDAGIYKGYLDSGELGYETLQRALRVLDNKVICLHAEDYGSIDNKKYTKSAASHTKAREIAETTAIKKVLRLDFGTNMIHFCHVSTKECLGLIPGDTQNVSCEVTPHHLFLDLSAYEKLKSFARVNPPLRSKEDVEGLWESLGKVDMVGTDHAPHTIEEKSVDVKDAPSGLPGVETMLPLMVDAVNRKRLSWPELYRLTSRGAAERFGLHGKGRIMPGADADLVVIDHKKEWTIKAENLHSKCGWTPYEGRKVKGSVESVYLRGSLMIGGGEFVGGNGAGKEVI